MWSQKSVRCLVIDIPVDNQVVATSRCAVGAKAISEQHVDVAAAVATKKPMDNLCHSMRNWQHPAAWASEMAALPCGQIHDICGELAK